MNKLAKIVLIMAGIALFGPFLWPWQTYVSYPIPDGILVRNNQYTGYGCAYAPYDPKNENPIECGHGIMGKFPPRKDFTPSRDPAAWKEVDRQRAKLMFYQQAYDAARTHVGQLH